MLAGEAPAGEVTVDAFELRDVGAERAKLGKLYLEFLRKPSLSLGVYVLAAGSDDPQKPHTEDEVYYVVRGRATINVDGEDRPVEAGSIVFVAATVPHRFHSIEEELELLVVFAPAEYARQSAG
jgi:mannose-6-phosphate isomerase-like protein (cupin superfamily)